MRCRGFTVMELLVVLLLVALLASLVTPLVTGSIHRAKESTLKENLYILRKAIDEYYTDAGAYPEELEALVEKRYIRKVPEDPLTGSKDTWILVHDEGEDGTGGIIDVRSGSEEKAGDGTRYSDW